MENMNGRMFAGADNGVCEGIVTRRRMREGFWGFFLDCYDRWIGLEGGR